MKILLVSHGGFSKAIVEIAEMISGKNNNIDYIGLYPEDSVNELSKKIEEKLVRDRQIKILMVDLQEGSPMIACIKAIKSLDREHISLFSGINLALLLEASQIVATNNGNNIDLNELILIGKESIDLVLEGKNANNVS